MHQISRYTPFEKLPDIMVPSEVAAYLGLDVDTVRDYIRRGLIKAAKQGRQYRVRKEWIVDYLEDSAEGHWWG